MEEPWRDPEWLTISKPSERELRNCVWSAITHWPGKNLGPRLTGQTGKIAKMSAAYPAQVFFGSSFAEGMDLRSLAAGLEPSAGEGDTDGSNLIGHRGLAYRSGRGTKAVT